MRHLSKTEIICNEVIRACCPEVLTAPMPVPVEKIMEQHYQLNPRPVTLIPDSSILGETIFVDGHREVWECKNGDLIPSIIPVRRGDVLLDEFVFCNMAERSAFTVAHELGHWELHQNFFCSTPSAGHNTNRKLEFEANKFAEALLLPRDSVRIATKAILEERQIKWQQFRQLQDRKNQIAFLQLTEDIAKIFQVSKDVARLRMERLFNIQ